MIISHFGRFFMLGPGLKFAGLEFGMLTTMADERHPSYDTIDRWYVSTKLYNTQLFSRGTWITTGDDIRRVYRCLQGGEIMLIALDGNETNNPARMEYPFCKGTLSLPGGIVRIAEKTGAKMVYASTIDNGVGVTITLSALPDTPQEAMQAAVALLEQDMCNGPWHWWQLAVSEAFWRQKEDVCTA
jgi:lauroyl/myristoyl acyltransferase